MKIKILTVCALWASLLWPAAYGQEINDPVPVETEVRQEIVDSVSSSYYDWNTLSMSGKLSSPLLPMSVSTKVYMERGKLLIITLSAPLVGEAGRIEIDTEQALVVNKMNNSFISIGMEEIEPMCPGGLQALQNLLLGRVTLLGEGQLDASNAGGIQIYSADDDTWMLLPNQDIESAPYVYFYTLDKTSLMLDRFAVLSQSGNSEVDCFYTWDKKNYTINFENVLNGKGMEATLRLNYPDDVAKPVQRMELSKKYRQTDLKGLMK